MEVRNRRSLYFTIKNVRLQDGRAGPYSLRLCVLQFLSSKWNTEVVTIDS